MKAIIVYYSHSANNELLAQDLKLRLGCDIVKIEEQKPRTGLTILLDLLFRREAKIKKVNVFLFDYPTVIFIAPIWNGKMATPLKTFIKMEKQHIKKYAFISVCSGREGQREKISEELIQLIQKKPIVVSELAINKLLPPWQQNKIKYTTPYRIKKRDIQSFKKEIQQFVNIIFERASELKFAKPPVEAESHL